MSAAQKWAWFNLAVIALSLLVVFAIVPFKPAAALGGFGFLGLLGFGPLFFRKKPGHVVGDERDQLIWQRSVIIGYAVFWVAFCSAGTLAPLVYGQCVPGLLVAASVWAGLVLFMGTMSVAMLAQYGRRGRDAQ
jgi:hypothetical protein